MSALSDNLLLGAPAAAAGGISRSLRFNSSDSAYLSRTPSSAGNRKTWTFSAWVKRSALGGNRMLMSCQGNSDSTTAQFWFNSDQFMFGVETANLLTTTAVFRDVSAWYHIVFAFDSTNATAADRMILYVNGVRQATSTYTAPTLNADYGINRNVEHNIGRRFNNSDFYFDGYLAEIHFIDGQALTPSSFAEVSATTGQLIPKAYTGSYGTNGFRLSFSDNSGTTSTTLGKDAAGSNNWTPNNFSVASGSGNDSLVDTPTSYGTDTGAGGEVRGNYAVFNALALNGNTLSNGNLDYLAGSANKPTLTTVGIPNTGKWYFEFTDVNSTGSFTAGVGTASVGVSSYLGADANGWGYQTHPTNAGYHNSGVFTTTGRINGAGSNTIVGVAIDRDAQKIWFSVNGTYVNSGVPASGTNAQYSNLPSSGELFPGASTGSGQNIVFNAGQRPFAYTAPSGFKALCDTNLPAPVVAKPNTVMDVITYTGTGSSLALPNGSSTPTSISFTPDFAWIKGRSGATDHALYDAVRGVQKDLVSNSTSAETTETTGLTAFGTNTFTVGSLAKLNTSSSTYVAWAWNAGGSTVTNTQGSITSSCRTNQSSGFSIVSYTGNGGSNVSVGHGLGIAPVLLIVKSRSTANDWDVTYTFGDGSYDFMSLNTTAAKLDIAGRSAPTSTLFYVNGGLSNVNGTTYVAYAWAPVAGYSSFGSYTGNGSSDGPFVFTGMRPRFLMIKRTDSTGSWHIMDTARDTYNYANLHLYPNASSAEAASSHYTDILSNGFKARGSATDLNGSGGTYIYAAFAESPFNYARAR